MKFLPAFLFMGFFFTLAFMVWTDDFPYHLIPLDEYDPNRVSRIREVVEGLVGKFGTAYTSLGLMIAGCVTSLYFVMDKRDGLPR